MQALNDLVAGAVSGLLCAVVEHPFDTIKTRMQTYGGTYRRSITRLVRTEGLLGLYRGLPARLGASGLEHSLTFGGYKGALRLAGADERHPKPWQILMGGIGGGVATTAVLTPFELVKCRMQVHSGATYNSSAHCALALFREGGVRAFYRGGRAMLLREVYGTTVWCGTNDLIRERLSSTKAHSGAPRLADVVVAGGVSGIIYSALVYPTDVIKTRIQVDHRFARCSVLETARAIVQHSGWRRGFYRGFGVVALCAFPSSATVFVGFELSRALLEKEEHRLQGDAATGNDAQPLRVHNVH